MKLWISGRIDSDIDGLAFRETLQDVENAVNAVIETRDYGPAIEGWDIIMVIFKDVGVSTFKYSARSKETDIEVVIDHQQFKTGDHSVRKKLFFDALILSLEKLQESKKIKEFSFESALADVKAIREKALS